MVWITIIFLLLVIPPIILGEIALCKFLINKIWNKKGGKNKEKNINKGKNENEKNL